MYKASLVTSYNFYKKNRIFKIDDPTINKDNDIYVYWYLKSELSMNHPYL